MNSPKPGLAATGDRPRRRRRSSRLVVTSACAAMAFPAGLALWSDRPYPLDLLAHFLALPAVALVLVGLVLLLTRRRRVALWALFSGALCLGVCRMGARVPSSSDHVPDGLRIVHYNAYGEHSRGDDAFVAWLRDQDADLVAINDAPWGWVRDYPYLQRVYPHRVEPSPGLEWPAILLSKHPARIEPLVPYAEETKFSFVARRSLLVSTPHGDVLFTTMHPPSPRTSATWRRSLEIVSSDGPLIRRWHERTGVPVLLPGDFNSTTQGRVHRTFARLSGLASWAPLVFAGTWPSNLPTWISLPIDRMWASEGVRVIGMKVGPRFRSDHRPVVIDVALPSVGSGRVGGVGAQSETENEPEPASAR